MFLGIWLAERGWIPDFLLRIAVKFISKARIKKSGSFSEKLDVISSLRDGPIAESTPFANKQHYEVPPAFFENIVLSRLLLETFSTLLLLANASKTSGSRPI